MAEKRPVEKYQGALREHANVVVHGNAEQRAASSKHVSEVAVATYVELSQQYDAAGGQQQAS